MPDVTLALGGIVDIASSADVAKVSDRVDGLAALLAGKGEGYATPRVASGRSAGASNVVLDLGGPQQGEVWDVRSVFLTADTALFGAAIAKPSALYITAGQSDTTPPAHDAQNFAASVPAVWPAGGKQYLLQFPEHLVVVTLATGAGINYVATARAVVSRAISVRDITP